MTTNSDSRDGIAASANEKASTMYSYAQRSIDRVVSPSSRRQAYDVTSDFASERPILFSFLVGQLLFSFIPILLFATFSLSTVAFALGTALVFALFWIGVAFMVLVPTLLVTSSIAVLVWGWAVGSFIIARWLYNHTPFGVHETNNGIEIVKKDDGSKY
ncbi:hypothetical protein B0T10DRAFT_561352 [Thelonectria olida]|uniref:Uncharacterized protein n=1 Tax=Thelonectria olida TaxID=1576542 RepID=A0A9P8W7Y1_9HYPO|nr:hypothetical protein B0T10DRAFT_561352 [Thelonectria olida]